MIYPYVSNTQMLRPSLDRYAVQVGHYRGKADVTQPQFLQMQYARGINNYLSAFTGLHYAQAYSAYHVGLVLGTGIGIWSSAVDMVYRQSEQSNSQQEIKLKLGYSYFINQSQSYFSLALGFFKYSTYSDYFQLRGLDAEDWLNATPFNATQKRVDAQFNYYQKLPQSWGNLSIAASYAHTNSSRTHRYGLNIAYHQRYKSLNYSLTIHSSSKQDARGHSVQDWNYLLSFSMPLSLNKRNAQFTGDLQRQGAGVGLAMNVTDVADLSMNFSHIAAARQNVYFSGRIRHPNTMLYMGYGQSKRDRQYALGLSGSLLAHRHGILWSADQGSTMAMIYAPKATGAKVQNSPGLRINHKGYALVPYLSPFKVNAISIDSSSMPNHVEFEYSRLQVIPYADAILSLKFPTRYGYALFIRAKMHNQQVLPFYAPIYDSNHNLIGHVAQGSLIYIRTSQLKGQIKIELNQEQQQYCYIDYDVWDKRKIQQLGYALLEGLCVSKA